ncbi:peptidylprolyl isomerase fpr3 [Mycoemilia scoparia]|uniref:peptidylprolyl isomerase n=1 Tax=Mycoemilia scoparia TaxID=417184 RepID=A0A9W8DVM0_9FUNG|nr:peptidylprolyl isomerase fpr3 [Mycoemilia scoparia]
MICGFWGLKVLPGKTYTQTVDTSFRLSNASLDEEVTDSSRTVLKVTVDKKSFVICALIPEKIEQQIVDLTFTEGEEVTFEIVGNNTIHLTGNLIPEIPDDEFGETDDEDEDDLDPEERLQLLIENGLVGDLDDDSEEEYSSDASEGSTGIKEVEDEDQMDEEEEEPKPTPTKKEKKAANEKRKKSEPSSETSTPVQSKKQKTALKKEEAAEKKTTPKKEDKHERKEHPNGLITEDKKAGQGVTATKGKKVGIYYIGKLAKNGKVFDKNTSGKPLWFGLGKGDVIKGMDQGVLGMQKGGERRITIPSKLGYGRAGAPPDIPPNSDLIFDIKVVEIKK